MHLARLKQNVEINKLDIEVLDSAIGDRNGEAILKTDNETDGVCPSMMDGLDHKTFCTVPMITFDELCSRFHPTIIKMDIEGFEQKTLEAAEDALSERALFQIFLEIHPRHSGNPKIENELTVLFNSYGYDCVYRDERGDEIMTEWAR